MDQMIQIDEGRMKDIFTADEEGKSAKEIAKALKLPLGTVKKILGEDNDLQEFSDSQLDVLARQYAGLKGKTISVDNANKLRQIFKRIPDSAMDALRKKKIPFLSGLALSRMVQKGMPVKEDTETPEENNVDKIKLAKEKDTDALEKQLVTAQGQINILKQKLENEKNKAVKPEPNKETGEVPLTVGIAHKYLKDKQEKEKDKKEDVKEMAKDDAYAIGMAQAKKSMNDEKPLEKKTITKGHEIAKKILAKEETLHEFKKMTVTINDPKKRKQAAWDLETLGSEQNVDTGFKIKVIGNQIKVDGMGADLNKYAKDMKNFYGASVRAESYSIDESADEETITEFTSQQIKQAYGIANDPRYKAGNYDGAVKAIEKLAKGLSKHPDVAKVLKRTNESAHEGARLVFETIKGIKNKADKTGMPYSILKKVYDRGMAAWRGGHRPGTSQQQWAFARVNSFVTKSSGTWGGADKDLAKQVRGKN